MMAADIVELCIFRWRSTGLWQHQLELGLLKKQHAPDQITFPLLCGACT